MTIATAPLEGQAQLNSVVHNEGSGGFFQFQLNPNIFLEGSSHN